MNTYFTLKNRTQPELMDDFRVNIFDTGKAIENFKQNFGNPSNKLLWLLPIDTLDKTMDGHNFYFYYETS